MFSRDRVTRSLLVILSASMSLVLASCGDDTDFGLGPLQPVTGTVTYNGKPLERGQINFLPDDPKGVGSMGIIENGSYVLGTVGEKNGARAGKYKVVIISKEDVAEQAKAEFEKVAAKQPNAPQSIPHVPREFLAKMVRESKSLIPAGYGDIRTTPLTAEVKEGTNNIPFTISDTDAPPEPPKDTAKGKGRRK